MRETLRVADAFSVLGLQEGASLELVKAAYKQAALRTHPDKNPDNASATAEFQRVGEAYRALVKYYADSSEPRARFHPSFDDDSYSDEYDHGEEYFYDDDDDSEEEIDMRYYFWLYEEMMGRAQYARRGPQARHINRETPETPKQYQERLRRSREQQLAAQERLKQDAAVRKARQEREREEERLQAEKRQKSKVAAKKAQAEEARESSNQRARLVKQQGQAKRSSAFVAARQGDAVKAKKAIWEDAVDAAGGEVKPGCGDFVQPPPRDPQETLLHIATSNGDSELVKWLDTHGADPEERNSEGFTAFHLSLKQGHVKIVNHFLETYPPEDSDSDLIYDHTECSNLLSLSLESREPEVVWLVLDRKLATSQEISEAWTWATSENGIRVSNGLNSGVSAEDVEKSEDMLKLLARYGGFSYPSATQVGHADKQSCAVKEPLQQSRFPSQGKPSKSKPTEAKKNYNYGRGRGRGRGRGGHNAPPAH
ncbi:hypothetical protein B0H34DRAFT_695572 [Crassisporium funariophilum]|nr:hypothetical protein B0H34DRAFT_695572 [Crassisporium funariophilum]